MASKRSEIRAERKALKEKEALREYAITFTNG